MKWINYLLHTKEITSRNSTKNSRCWRFLANRIIKLIIWECIPVLSKDSSLSSSLVHFQMPKHLQSFNHLRPNIAKIFEEFFNKRRFFVFIFGPFSIFVATLMSSNPGFWPILSKSQQIFVHGANNTPLELLQFIYFLQD